MLKLDERGFGKFSLSWFCGIVYCIDLFGNILILLLLVPFPCAVSLVLPTHIAITIMA
jgi:hypothetical protein